MTDRLSGWDLEEGDRVMLGDEVVTIQFVDVRNEYLSCGCCSELMGWRIDFVKENGEEDSTFLYSDYQFLAGDLVDEDDRSFTVIKESE